MVYKINNKYYLKIQGYYKEINVIPKGDDFEIKVKPNSKIEITKAKNVNTVDLKKEFKPKNGRM